MCTFRNDITYKGSRLTIIYDYTPSERQTYEHPGCPEIIEVTNILVGPYDITELLSDQQIDAMVEAMREADMQIIPDDTYIFEDVYV